MSRQSPNRNQRSKGIKIKHVLQICLLVAICFWLIYQVKHSPDRKEEFDEIDEKVLRHRESTDGMIKLGRKDVHSQVEEIVYKNVELDDVPEEEDDAPGEKRIRENENEGLEGEEEEIEEHELEKLETEIDREEVFFDSEEGEDGDDRSSHEAHEEHYKADDASSAVIHDTQIDGENSSEYLGLILGKEKKKRTSDETNTSENRKELGVENGEMAERSNPLDVAIKETLLGNSQNGLFSNNTLTEGSHHLQVNDTSTEASLGDRSSSLGSITASVSVNSINGSISTISAKTGGVDSKSMEFSRTSNGADSFESVKISTSEASIDEGDGKNEIFDSRMPEIFEQLQHDPIDFSDTSNSLEDKDVPATLFHGIGIWNQGTHTEDAAAE